MSIITITQGDSAELLRQLADNSVDALVTDPPAGIAFMGAAWDRDKGGRDKWIAWLEGILVECLRVLKPGAHGLVWALPRTAHWTATAAENAGFEIRDVVSHLFGTGFPKSLDVSKAIDSYHGAEREVVGTQRMTGTARQLAGGRQHGAARTNAVDAPERVETVIDITAPATPDAQRWQGFGTALKPAAEQWILVRKPLDGTVAHNALEHGTGAINVDGCRIGTSKRVPSGTGHNPELGRWPANVVLSHAPECTDEGCVDGCAVATLDEQSGEGGASCFFYCAKPSRAERDAGLESLPVHTAGEVTGGRAEGSAGLNSPRSGAGRTSGARNIHPTVKSLDLMRWLVRLVTPPGGLVLDPFAGSGSTGCACAVEGFDFVGFEAEPAHAEIARLRIAYARASVRHVVRRDGSTATIRSTRPARPVRAAEAPLFEWGDP